MMLTDLRGPKGVLRLEEGRSKMRLDLRAPSNALAPFIEHYWFVTWDLRGQQPYLQENLPHPSVHLVTENDRTLLYGVVTGKFSYRLAGRGRVFGIKFLPGAFHAFVGTPVSRLTDRRVDPFELFGFDARELEAANVAGRSDDELIVIAERQLLARSPGVEPAAGEIGAIVTLIRDDRSIRKVDDLLAVANVGKRSLERRFGRYVGVGPKWVIKRYRLVEAAEEIAHGGSIDWARLAVDLGYFDQAHFIRDFKGLIGLTPADYAHAIRR